MAKKDYAFEIIDGEGKQQYYITYDEEGQCSSSVICHTHDSKDSDGDNKYKEEEKEYDDDDQQEEDEDYCGIKGKKDYVKFMVKQQISPIRYHSSFLTIILAMIVIFWYVSFTLLQKYQLVASLIDYSIKSVILPILSRYIIPFSIGLKIDKSIEMTSLNLSLSEENQIYYYDFITGLLIYIVLDQICLYSDETIQESLLVLPALGIQSESKIYKRSIMGLVKCLIFKLRGKDNGNKENVIDSVEKIGYKLDECEKKFISIGSIQDILINEGFRRFEVIFYLLLIVKDDENGSGNGNGKLVVLFPRLLPRGKFLEIVRNRTKKYI